MLTWEPIWNKLIIPVYWDHTVYVQFTYIICSHSSPTQEGDGISFLDEEIEAQKWYNFRHRMANVRGRRAVTSHWLPSQPSWSPALPIELAAATHGCMEWPSHPCQQPWVPVDNMHICCMSWTAAPCWQKTEHMGLFQIPASTRTHRVLPTLTGTHAPQALHICTPQKSSRRSSWEITLHS